MPHEVEIYLRYRDRDSAVRDLTAVLCNYGENDVKIMGTGRTLSFRSEGDLPAEFFGYLFLKEYDLSARRVE